MPIAPEPTSRSSIKALKGEIAGAADPQILRIVATVDAMASRGPADALIAPLRERLSMLRPPRPLRFARLLFHPLDPLIVPAAGWRDGEDSIPRTALAAMADHVRMGVGDKILAIEREIAGHTDADTDLVTRFGRSLWPAAADTLRRQTVPVNWETSGLMLQVYRPLADCVAALLDEAANLEALCAGTANGLLPVRPGAVIAMLDRVMAVNHAALPMMIALLLVRLPEAAASILGMAVGSKSMPIRAAMDRAVDRVLGQLSLDGGTEDFIAAGTLADAGAAAGHIKTLLTQLDGASSKPQRREQLRSIRQHLDASCKARFTAGLEQEFLAPLRQLADTPNHSVMTTLETAARSLRMLETEARAIGSGAAYDLLLRRAADMIKKNGAPGGQMGTVDQVRLVELLAGPEAALAMLSRSG
jgi:hypothetical protein